MIKQCISCKLNLAISEYHKHPSSKDRLVSKCKICCSKYLKEYRIINSSKLKANKREEYQRNRNRYLERELIRKYGITMNTYNQMLKEQDYKCRISNASESNSSNKGKTRAFDVDHCHETGIVRGLLCGLCNVGLGSFRDNTDLLVTAIHYLNNNKGLKYETIKTNSI